MTIEQDCNFNISKLPVCVKWIVYIVLVLGVCHSEAVKARSSPEKPNVLLIVVDDAGFSDFGFMGSEISTPNIDKLASNGVVLTNIHALPSCSPTRAMLLSGADNHAAGLGNMFEEITSNQKGQPGYEGYLHERVAPLPAIFQDAGYGTYMVGKWHLGHGDDQGPVSRGFDRAFALINGGASHFPDMRKVWATDVKNPGKVKYRDDGILLESLPPEFEYSSQYYVDKMISYLEQHSASSESNYKPFFAYLSFTAPHFPLQAPDAAIARFNGKYDGGYDELAKKRLYRQIDLGVLPKNTVLAERPIEAAAWNQLSAEDQARSARSMEIYAAMIDEIDRNTGRLLYVLKSSGALGNTVIVFMSDNGAEGHHVNNFFPESLYPKAREWYESAHNFELEAMGKPGSYVFYGPGWAWASAPAFRGYKGFVSQGGTRVPAFIYHPAITPGGGQINELLSVKDIVPTLLELAGIQPPKGQFRNRKIIPITGQSFASEIRTGRNQDFRLRSSKERVIGIELFGKRSIRQGSWSIVHMQEPQGVDDWQLYNLESDLAETNDLAKQRPEKLESMKQLWEDYVRINRVILPNWVSGY